MRLGVLVAQSPNPEDPASFRDFTRAIEAEGFDSIWAPQMIGRGMMALDPLAAMTAAATATDEIEVGTAILQLPLYQPVDVLHRVLSLRQLAGDRLTLGVGPGSTAADFEAFGRDHATRFAAFTAALATLREGLASGKVGEVDLTPPPTILGRPRLIYGTWGKGVERAARHFDGWVASAFHRTDDEVIAALPRYRAAGGGRAIVSSIVFPPGADPGKLRGRLDRFAEAGFDDAVVAVAGGPPALPVVRGLLPRTTSLPEEKPT
ncbi:MAG: LLM class flavin-dependent oxidoreductase [Acidobacteria bacterium]|nr:LLM class flavin-dependent oxidoreductase [Acidobacteriota bacterium]